MWLWLKIPIHRELCELEWFAFLKLVTFSVPFRGLVIARHQLAALSYPGLSQKPSGPIVLKVRSPVVIN